MEVIVSFLVSVFEFTWGFFISLIPKRIIKTTIIKKFQSWGITINGNQPWDVIVKNEGFYKRLASSTSAAFGEAYMDGWIECNDLAEMQNRVCQAGLNMPIPEKVIHILEFGLLNQQTKRRSLTVVKEHYDLGNDLFCAFLDPYMNYTCGYWRNADNLNKAQEDKMDLIARKLQLKPGMKVLDIGCGWGGLAKYLAEKYQVSVVGITISKEQMNFARKFCEGLPVEIRLLDYRDLNEQFDRIVVVGVIEHIGAKNYQNFFQIINRSLPDDGLFLLQTIGLQHDHILPAGAFLNKYIFPGGMVPHDNKLLKASKGLLFVEDWHNFGLDYDKTLLSWYDNFNRNWPQLRPKYGDKFYRMWTFYLLSCAGLFRSRKVNLWHVVFSKDGLRDGYLSQR